MSGLLPMPPSLPPPVQAAAHEPVPPVSPGRRPEGYRPLLGSLLTGGFWGAGGGSCAGVGVGGGWGGCFVPGHLHPTLLPCPPQREEHPGPVVRGLRTWFILSPATL